MVACLWVCVCVVGKPGLILLGMERAGWCEFSCHFWLYLIKRLGTIESKRERTDSSRLDPKHKTIMCR